MSNSFMQNSEHFKAWSYIMTKAITHAISSIMPTTGQPNSIDSISIGRINPIDVPKLLGGPESLVIGSYSALSGTINAHIMILNKPDLILKTINVNSGTLSTLDEKQQCTVVERESGLQNTIIQVMEDMLAVQLHPTSSVILVDKATALLDIALTEFLHENDSVFVAETMVMINGQAMQGTFIIVMDQIFIQLARNLTVGV
jgi:hypothetical protein